VGDPLFLAEMARALCFDFKPAVGKNRGGSSGGLQVEAVLISGNSTDQEATSYVYGWGEPTRPGVCMGSLSRGLSR
jgi:hypothetical protein